MGRIVEVAPIFNFDEVVATKGAGYKPDFRILTAGIESDRKNERLVHMVGSSTEKDLQGDVMSIFALQSMTKAAPNLTVWLNHDYSLPDSIFGSIVQTPTIHHRDGIADLHLDVDVELENPAAARVKRYIDNGRRLGCSIGCMVTKYEIADESDEDFSTSGMGSIIIHDVYVVEYSVVGIPANQRSWVENAIRGVFTRTLDPGLAPAMKSLWPNKYEEIMRGIPDERLRKRIDALPSRPRPQQKLSWHAPTKQFVFAGPDGKERPVSNEEASLLVKDAPKTTETLKAPDDWEAEAEIKELIPNEINMEDADGDDGGDDDDVTDGPMDEEGKCRLFKDGLNHSTFNGEHTHIHDSFGFGDTPTHTHTHSHVNDNNHNHNHTAFQGGEKSMEPKKQAQQPSSEEVVSEPAIEVKALPVEQKEVEEPAVEQKEVEEPALVQLDETKRQFLQHYNNFGKTLGLPEVTEDMYVRGIHPATQPVIEPDTTFLQQCKSLQDTLVAIMEGRVVPEQKQDDPVEPAVTSDENFAVLGSFGDKLASFGSALEGLNVLALKKDADETRATIEIAKKELDRVLTEVRTAKDTVDRLKSMPLGNPTHQSRSVHSEDNVVSRDELLRISDSQNMMPAIAHDSLAQALALTEVKSIDYGNGQTMRHRHWPSGVGGSTAKGVRPPLTANQIQFMDFNDITAYREGAAAKVPYLDNQVDNGTASGTAS